MSNSDDIKKLRFKLLEAMSSMANNGSVPAAQTAAKMLDDLEIREISNEHSEKLESSTDEEKCYYLGKIGESRMELVRHLNREPSDEEMMLFEKGVKDRKLEIKAIELELAKRGAGKVKNWMKR